MSSKQFQAGKPIETRQPIHQSHTDLQKNQKEEGKRPFTPFLPPLLQRATQAPQSITPAEAAYLQRTVGNQAIGRMLRVQAKSTVDPVGDTYEQEADTVARQVVQKINTPKPKAMQRQEEDEIQAKPFALNPAHFSFLQRQEEEEELQMKPSSTMAGGEMSSDIESKIQRAKGSGRPLSNHIRTPMEQGFGADFSNVKIHTGSHNIRNYAVSSTVCEGDISGLSDGSISETMPVKQETNLYLIDSIDKYKIVSDL